MTLQIGYKNGQRVAYDPSDPLSSAGVTPAQSVQTETQTSTGQIVRGTTLQPAPTQGTITNPIGGTIEGNVAQQSFIQSAQTGQPQDVSGTMQGIGTPPYTYGVEPSSALTTEMKPTITYPGGKPTQISGKEAEQIIAAQQVIQPQLIAPQTTDQQAKTYLESGKIYNPFSHQYFEPPKYSYVLFPSEAIATGIGSKVIESGLAYAVANIEPPRPTTYAEGYVPVRAMSEASILADIAWQKADWLQKGLLEVSSLRGSRGAESNWAFLGQYLPIGTTKSLETITKEQMATSLINPNFINNEAWGSLSNTETGIAGTSLLFYYGVGTVAGEIIPRLPAIPILTGIGQAIVSHPKEMILATGVILGYSEVMKQQQMQTAGFTVEQRAGELTKDIIGFAAAREGFVRGFQEGLPFKFWRKDYIPAENIIEPQVLSGKEAFPTSQQSPQGLLKEFQTSSFRLYEDKSGGWHATTSYFVKDTITQAGTSELPGMYISPSLSPHFLGITDTSYSYLTKPVSGAGAKALWIQTDIELAPENILGNKNAGWDWLMNKAPRGKAFILGTKIEKEAIIPPNSRLIRTSEGFWGFEKFTKINDIRIPIFEYATVSEGGEAAASVVKSFSGINELVSSYARGAGFTSVWTSEVAASIKMSIPSSMTSQSFKSLVSPVSRPSVPSIPSVPSMPSYPSISKISIPSYPSISKISIPSYPSMPSSPSIQSIPSIPSIASPPSIPSYPSVPSIPSIISPPSYPPFSFSFPNLGSVPRRKGKHRRTRQPRGYLPSMGAVLMGIRGSMPKGFGGMLSGLEMRPLVNFGGRKHRKKRKR